MLEFDPKKRIGAREVLKSEWLWKWIYIFINIFFIKYKLIMCIRNTRITPLFKSTHIFHPHACLGTHLTHSSHIGYWSYQDFVFARSGLSNHFTLLSKAINLVLLKKKKQIWLRWVSTYECRIILFRTVWFHLLKNNSRAHFLVSLK